MPKVQLSYMPATGGRVIGRAMQLEMLNDAWQGGRIRVVSVIGLGGIGKTTLVSTWLNKLSNEGFNDVDTVFAWSFYDSPNADDFFAEFIRFLGHDGDSPANYHEQLELILAHFRSNRTLLVLDGFERLQNPDGEVIDARMSSFLRRMAYNRAGRSMCVLTSRYDIPEFGNHASVKTIVLQPLSDAEGVELLRQLGTRGSDDEFTEVVREYSGHPLSLQLLGTYLAHHHSGDVRQRSSLDVARQQMQRDKAPLSFDLWVDPGAAGVEDLLALFRSLSALSRAYGGPGLIFSEEGARVYTMEAANS